MDVEPKVLQGWTLANAVDAIPVKRLLAALFVAALALGAHGARAKDSDPAQIVSLEHRWLAAIRSGDREALGQILADGFIDIDTDGRMRDRAEAIARASAPPDATQKITQLNVRVFGDTAIADGINTVHLQSQGWIVGVAFTDVFVRKHGAWRAVSAQETLRKPPPVRPATH
ncbi:MAG: nuclear transport factor 2 family protein [Rhodanobacteraceae bacterium]